MTEIKGTYYNGKVRLEKEIHTDHTVNVTVVFEEEVPKAEQKRLKLSDFSFHKTREILKNTKGSLSDTVIEERRESL